MKKRQTRRSISLKGITHQRLKNFCEIHDLSISGYLETIIMEKLDAAGVPVPERIEPRPKKQHPNPADFFPAHRTF